MTVDLIQILSAEGQSVVDRIRQNLISTGTNASGTTSRSLRYTVTVSGNKTILKVIGKPYFMTVETGRGPTRNGNQGGKTLVESIREWMRAKQIEGSPYGIARVIHDKGTKLYRSGGRKDIVSNVVNRTLIDQIQMQVLKQFADAYIKVINPV